MPQHQGTSGSTVHVSRSVSLCTQAFKSTDKKRQGTIPIKSLKDILETIQKAPLTNQQFYLITADADVEDSGTIEFGEYMTVCSLPALSLSITHANV
jgi:Ca2+-binding EF-hand superfamily protein